MKRPSAVPLKVSKQEAPDLENRPGLLVSSQRRQYAISVKKRGARAASVDPPLNKDEYVRVLEKNQEVILAHVLKIEREGREISTRYPHLIHFLRP